MSDIVTVRRQVKQVASILRQGKIMPAAKSVVEALKLVLTKPLMKAEKDEFMDSISEAVDYLNNDANLRKLYPLAIEYVPGEEKKTLEQLVELLEIVNEDAMSGVAEMTQRIVDKKQAALNEGQCHLDAHEYDKARKVFSDISTEFADDADLKSQIGEKVLAAGLFEDAAQYFEEAVALDPNALHNYNRLAISLRKLGRFELAEEKYLTVLPLAPEDPFLLFNMGRLYAEWSKWDKALEYGEKAFALKPDFVEAQKLANFARKRL
ncbi:MAG: hypothetical protein DELT_00093 [Desulfovibrio sp.]